MAVTYPKISSNRDDALFMFGHYLIEASSAGQKAVRFRGKSGVTDLRPLFKQLANHIMSKHSNCTQPGNVPCVIAGPIQLSDESQQSASLSGGPAITGSKPKGRSIAEWLNLYSFEELKARFAATAKLITEEADNLISHFGRDVLSACEVLQFFVEKGLREPGCASGIGVALGMGGLKLPSILVNGVRYWDIAAIRLDPARWPERHAGLYSLSSFQLRLMVGLMPAHWL